jgi:hypothetical protein
VGLAALLPLFSMKGGSFMGKIDWDVVTNFTDAVTTTLKTVTFPKVQEQVYLRNQGNANFTYTLGSQSGTLTPGQSVTVNQDVSSFTLQAVSGTHTFEVRAKEKGTEINETDKAQQLDLTNFIKARNKNMPYKRNHFLLYDSFTRADSATTLGNAEFNTTPYSYLSAGTGVTWGIQNNSAYIGAVTTSGRSMAYQEMNESDGIIEADITGIGTNNGLAFRITDKDNFWYCVISPTQLSLAKYAATVSTVVASSNRTFTDCKLTIKFKGSKIEVYVDGFLLIRVFDSFNSTATKHGLYSRADILTTRWSNFCVKPLGDVNYTLKEGFENSLPWYWQSENAGLSYSQTFDTNIKKTGSRSLRIELHKDDPDVASSKRSEIRLPSEEALEEHWYGVSIYLPKGGTEDYATDTQRESIIQWHTTPDSGEENVSPPLSLQTVDGHYDIVLHTDVGRMSTQNPYSMAETITNIGSYDDDKGKWTDWVFHVKWGWLSEQDPITEVYKNGVLVYESNGLPNCMNDGTGVYLKLGVYKWTWKMTGSIIDKRVVYYDDFWMK